MSDIDRLLELDRQKNEYGDGFGGQLTDDEQKEYDALLQNVSSNFKIRLIKSVPQIYDKHRHELSVHFRMNPETKEFSTIINRSCQDCKKFFEIKDGTWICKKCKYEQDWLVKGLS